MRYVYCSICSTSLDADSEGVEGDIGIIPVAFCPTCKAGIHDFAVQTWDLVPAEEVELLREKVEKKGDDWDCGCPEAAEASCMSVVCPRQ